MEDSKTPAYSQPGYGYHQPNHNINGTEKQIISRDRGNEFEASSA